MESKSVHFRYILLYYFRKGQNAKNGTEKLRDMYGDEALQERRHWN